MEFPCDILCINQNLNIVAYLFDYVGDLNEILCFAGRKNCPEFNMSCAYMAKFGNVYSSWDIENTFSMILISTFMGLRKI